MFLVLELRIYSTYCSYLGVLVSPFGVARESFVASVA